MLKRDDAVRLMGWNIQAGGFASYDPGLTVPEREAAIHNVLSDARARFAVDTASLIDAYRWDAHYGGESGIAEHTGFKDARFVPLNDERLNRKWGHGMGLAFVTDRFIQQAGPLDLDTRQGLGVVLDIGHYGLQIANVYLDDLSEDVRLRQARALLSGIETDVPTLLVGDFNALRADMRGASLLYKAGDMAVRGLARLLAPRSELGMTVRGMNRRQVVPMLMSHGYADADAPKKRPTAPARLPIFGLDYVFYNNRVVVDDACVLQTKMASDHRPLFVSARTAG